MFRLGMVVSGPGIIALPLEWLFLDPRGLPGLTRGTRSLETPIEVVKLPVAATSTLGIESAE